MKTSAAGIASLLLAVVANPASADSSVWRVSEGSSTLYLGGTVHLLRPSDYPLPEEFETAYNAADELVFETDLSSMGDLATQAQMLAELTYNDARTLQSVLNEQAYAALEEYTASVGLPISMMQKFKPGMVISTLQVMQFQSMGFTPEGVDAYFNERALGDGKALAALETVQEQIGFLAAMGEGNESEFILLSLSDLEESDAMMEDMISAWREGNTRQLSDMFVDDMREQAPEIYESLLRSRNLAWLPQIESMLADANTEFVLVGAAHLVGEDGLLAMLTAAGYEVEKL
ncbi:MAG: TraB/GumN family protein [Pseudomonadales bacterium]|nr:TraB/GumN family protein [Pseudomonadales bacterium]